MRQASKPPLPLPIRTCLVNYLHVHPWHRKTSIKTSMITQTLQALLTRDGVAIKPTAAMAGWLHEVCVCACWFVPPQCGFSLSLSFVTLGNAPTLSFDIPKAVHALPMYPHKPAGGPGTSFGQCVPLVCSALATALATASKSYMDMASKLFTFTFTFTACLAA